MSEAERAGVTEDALLGGRVRLRQPARGYRAGTDAVLLAGLAEAREGDHVADLGSATGAAGLMLAARRPAIRLTLIERDPDLAARARENLRLNGRQEGQDRVLLADAFSPNRIWREAGGPVGEIDLVISNPPFFDGRSHRASPDPGRRAAHVLQDGSLADWLSCAARMLKPKGRLCLIHRADSLAECLAACGSGFGALAVRPIHPRADLAATRIFVTAVRGGRAPVTILPALVLHDETGGFSPDADALHRPHADHPQKGGAAENSP